MINQTRLYVLSQILKAISLDANDNIGAIVSRVGDEIERMLPENPLVVERIVPIMVSDSIKIVAREQGKIPAIKKIREQYNLSLLHAKQLIESQCDKEIGEYNAAYFRKQQH